MGLIDRERERGRLKRRVQTAYKRYFHGGLYFRDEGTRWKGGKERKNRLDFFSLGRGENVIGEKPVPRTRSPRFNRGKNYSS